MKKIKNFLKIIIKDLWKHVLKKIILTVIASFIIFTFVSVIYYLTSIFADTLDKMMLLCFSLMLLTAIICVMYGIFRLCVYLHISWLRADDHL